MEFKQAINELIQKYQYWRAPRCELCGVKLIDLNKSKKLFEGYVRWAPQQRFEISITQKGSLKFFEYAVGFGGTPYIVRNSSWCNQDAPPIWSLIRQEMNYKRIFEGR